MFRASVFVSNRNTELVTEGASFYSKYRIYSTDDLNSHFRLAAFGRYSFNNATFTRTNWNCGAQYCFEAGIVATKLIKKVAVSSISFEKRWTQAEYLFPSNKVIMQQTILYLWEINVSQKYTNISKQILT
jgi:hypothetical protein